MLQRSKSRHLRKPSVPAVPAGPDPVPTATFAPQGVFSMIAQDFTKFPGFEQFEQAAKTGQETFAKVQKAAKETAEKMNKSSVEAVTKGYDKFAAMTREQVEKAFPQAVAKFDEAAAFGKENLDAMFAASAQAQKAAEAIATEILAFNQKAMEAGVANFKAMFGMKSYQEIVEKQTAFARGQFDAAVAGMTKVSELAVKSTNDAVEPIQARFTKAAEKFAKPLAA
jgi:phasin family protein